MFVNFIEKIQNEYYDPNLSKETKKGQKIVIEKPEWGNKKNEIDFIIAVKVNLIKDVTKLI